MTPIKTILVVGATGRLGAPVAAELAKNFHVRALVRTLDKAKAMLPTNVEIVKGDLQERERSLHREDWGTRRIPASPESA